MKIKNTCCYAHLVGVPFVSTPTVCPKCGTSWTVTDGEWKKGQPVDATSLEGTWEPKPEWKD